ncbi:MAG: PSD1 domain-containing protein [Acidobacteria bacterium]|nr:PSD1 domain-containing protein [Acidobacteriota bacterium]
MRGYAKVRTHLLLFLAVAITAVRAGAQTAQAILNTKCLHCHGAARMSGLDLRDRAALLKGGTRGPAVVPGNAGASVLLQAVEQQGELKMPPGSAPLGAAEVKIIRQWIESGAKWDAASKPASANQWWSFRKPVRPSVPAVRDPAWAANPIDRFLYDKLNTKGLRPSPEADKRTLVRRAYFDLHGLPPTPEQVDAFVNDAAPEAYARLIDKLLESPRYGERWGRYWLDLVRYADTSGFETDHFYITAWRYRDYVIQSFNKDKPYDVFVKEQIAADELWPMSLDLEGTLKLPAEKQENVNRRIGTGLFTLGAFPIEYTYYGDQYRAEWQAEAVDLVGSAFLGLTMGCARCHDHKFDPLSQRDYYGLTAMFAGSVEREIPLVSLFDVQTASRAFPLLAQAQAYKQMASRAGRQGGANRGEMLQKLGEAYLRAPERYPTAIVLAHEETVPPTHVLAKGEWKAKGELVQPAFPAALNAGPPINEPKDVLFVPQRRKALALWLTDTEQPLLARVMINRIWLGHFGEGIVRTASDFGRQGDPPSHPELLDWLATEFVSRGWSMKQMHRQIMLSRAYRSASTASKETLAEDPENRYLSRFPRRRLDGDSIRDSILAVAGSLNLKMGGVGVIPPLTKEEMQAARMPNLWPAHPDPAEHNRRSIYLQMKRSLTLPMLQVFDAPDTATSCARRERSTVAPQALALMNSEFAAAQADQFAARIRKAAGSDDPAKLVETAWRFAAGRAPSSKEQQTAIEYLQRNSLARLALLIFNLNEFVYVD